MLCIFEGKERIKDALGVVVSQGRDARTIHDNLQMQMMACECNPAIQYLTEGCNSLSLVKETIEIARGRIRQEHAANHLPFDPLTVTDADCRTRVASTELSPHSKSAFISPYLKKDDGSPVTLEDFPDGHAFGNGVTANSRVQLKDGSVRYFTWCLLPQGTILSGAQEAQLCSICE